MARFYCMFYIWSLYNINFGTLYELRSSKWQINGNNFTQQQTYREVKRRVVMVMVNWLFNVTINDISVIYVTAHRCAGGLKKKLDVRSSSQRHTGYTSIHFVGFFPDSMAMLGQRWHRVVRLAYG